MNINIIGFPLFYGCDIEGVDRGPDFLRQNGLLNIFSKNHKVKDLGNVDFNKLGPEDKFKDSKNIKYMGPIARANSNLRRLVRESLSEGSLPLTIGGDHSLALGSLRGTMDVFGEDISLLWIDAHGDINTPLESTSKNFHGMPLALCIGKEPYDYPREESRFLKAENIYYLGVRDLDPPELERIKRLDIPHYSVDDIRKLGQSKLLESVFTSINKGPNKKVHLSLDIDVLDPTQVPGTGTPVPNGLDIEELRSMLDLIFKNLDVVSIDFVEFNPSLDKDQITLEKALVLLDDISNLLI